MTAVQLSVVLPTFNERQNIVPLIERLHASLAHLPHELIVVDDASPDGTAAVVSRQAAADPALRLIERVGARGLCTAIQDGIDASRGAAIAWMDCDLSMPPEALPRLHAALATHDVAVGSRYVAGGRDARDDVRVHRALSRLLNLVARALLGTEVADYSSGFVCARRPVFQQIRLAGDYGEYCIDLLHRARKLGFKIAEVPYVNTPRAAGESKTATSVTGLLRRGVGYLAAVVRLRLQYGR